MSQPRDDLSHQRLNMSRQTILCRDIIGKLPAEQFQFFPKFNDNTHSQPEVKTRRAQINRVINSD